MTLEEYQTAARFLWHLESLIHFGELHLHVIPETHTFEVRWFCKSRKDRYCFSMTLPRDFTRRRAVWIEEEAGRTAKRFKNQLCESQREHVDD